MSEITYNGRKEHIMVIGDKEYKFAVNNPPAFLIENTNYIDIDHCKESVKITGEDCRRGTV